MLTAIRITAQILLFAVAFIVFYAGLFIGLQVSPNLGTLLWICAAVIGVGDLAWVI